MAQPNARIPKNFPLMEDASSNVIGYDMGAPAGVEVPLFSVLIDVSTNAIKGGMVNSFGRNFLLTRLNTKEITAITHGSANLKIKKVLKAVAPTDASTVTVKSLALNAVLDVASATDTPLVADTPLLTEGDTLIAEITDGSSAAGLLLVTVHGIEINTQDAVNYD